MESFRIQFCSFAPRFAVLQRLLKGTSIFNVVVLHGNLLFEKKETENWSSQPRRTYMSSSAEKFRRVFLYFFENSSITYHLAASIYCTALMQLINNFTCFSLLLQVKGNRK